MKARSARQINRVPQSEVAPESAIEGAAKPRKRRMRKRQSAEGSSLKSNPTIKPETYLSKKFFQASLGFLFWQETILGSRGAAKANFETQFQGLKLQGSYLEPLNNVHWVPIYSGWASFGNASSVTSGGYAESLPEQSWFGLGGSAGMLYRFNNNAELGVAIPLEFRSTSYKVASQTILERANSFTFGASLLMVSRISKKSALTVSVTHQYVWDATQWGLAYSYDLR